MPKLVWQRGTSKLWLFAVPSELAEEEVQALKSKKDTVKRAKVIVYGKEHLTPRLQGVFSEDGKDSYTFSHVQHKCLPLSLLGDATKRANEYCRQVIRKSLDKDFDASKFVVNCYEPPADYIGAHRDNEDDVDLKIVYTRTLGCPRTLRIRDYETKRILFDCRPKHGEVVVMEDMQVRETHEVPRERRALGVRWSVTARKKK